MYDFNGDKIDNTKAEKILDNFKIKYIDETYPERILFINHLKKVERKIPIERITELNISKELELFMYHERLKKLYITKFVDVCEYVEQLEPWEDIDCLIFDKSFAWFVGINHNDILLIYGL